MVLSESHYAMRLSIKAKNKLTTSAPRQNTLECRQHSQSCEASKLSTK